MSATAELFAKRLFKGLAPDETTAFLRKCKEKSYPDGTNLFMEKSAATTLYLILDGGIDLRFEMAQREHADTTIASLKQGNAVGWSAVVPPHNYLLSGYCKGKTTLLEINRESLEMLFEANYHLAYIFMRNIAVLTGERAHHVQERLAKVLVNEAATGW